MISLLTLLVPANENSLGNFIHWSTENRVHPWPILD